MDQSLQSVSLLEHQHITEMHEKLRTRLADAQKKDAAGRVGGLRVAVLSMVVGENYEAAREELRNYVKARTAYPEFQARAERYVEHGCDLIQAIQTKRAFPGLASLSLAKQQEIHEKVLEHFEELKAHLKQMERVEREHRLDDVRSTVWVVRTMTQMVAMICVLALIIDLRDGVAETLFRVVDVVVSDITSWMVNLI